MAFRKSREHAHREAVHKLVEGEEREFVIGEPYGMDSSLVRELIKFCDEHGFDFDIGGDSTYYPGVAVVVRIFRKNP